MPISTPWLPTRRWSAGGRPEPAGQDAVESGRRTATLDVPQLGHAQLELKPCAVLGKISTEPFGVVGRALRHHDQRV